MSNAIDQLLQNDAAATLRLVLNTAGASLTDAQIDVLADALAYKAPMEIRRAFATVLPPERERLGILLPVLVPGPQQHYAHFVRTAVFYVLAAQEAINEDVFRNKALLALDRNLTPGTAGYYSSGGGERAEARIAWGKKDREGTLPWEAYQTTQSIDAFVVWSNTGISPSEIGTGYSGGAEWKGRNAAVRGTSAYLEQPAAGSAAAADAAMAAEARRGTSR